MRITFTFISLGILLGISSLALVANAQEESTSETTPREAAAQRRAEAAATMQERQETKAAAVAERRASLSARVQERVTNLAANTSNRVEAAVNRLTQIADRLETRANLLTDQGVDTAAAGAKLAEARTELEQVMILIGGIDETIADMVGSEEPYKAWQPVRETFLETKTHLIAARAALIETVALLKEAVAAAELQRGVSSAVTDTNADETEEETDTAE